MLRRRAAVCSAVAAVLLVGSPAAASNAPRGVCAARDRLVRTASAEGRPIEISFSNSEMLGELAFTSCWPSGRPAEREFCEAVVTAAGMHGLQGFPVWISECLRVSRASKVRIERVESAEWSPTIQHVEARVDWGLRLEVRYRPSDGDHGARTLDVYGTYDLVIRRR